MHSMINTAAEVIKSLGSRISLQMVHVGLNTLFMQDKPCSLCMAKFVELECEHRNGFNDGSGLRQYVCSGAGCSVPYIVTCGADVYYTISASLPKRGTSTVFVCKSC